MSKDYASYISPVIQLPRNRHLVGGAPAATKSVDFSTVDFDTVYSVVMMCVWFTTPKRIHGLWQYEGANSNQLFFAGYECNECHKIFLVPDSVNDERTLHESLQHKCMEAA